MSNIKNKCTIIISLLLISVFLMNACSAFSGISEEEAKTISTNFMESLKFGDEEAFNSITTENLRNNDDYSMFFDGTTFRDSIFNNSGVDYDSLSEEAKLKIEASIARIVKGYLSDYEIKEIKTQGSSALVTISINLKDYDNIFGETIIQTKLQAAEADYIAENYDRLQTDYRTLGEDATMKIILNEFVPIYLDLMADEVETEYSTLTQNHTIKLKIEKKDGSCIITEAGFK